MCNVSNWCVLLDRCWLGGANSAVRPAAISCVSIHCVSLKHESKRCNVKRALDAVKHAIRQIFNVMYVYVRDTVRVAPPRVMFVKSVQTFTLKCSQTELNLIGCFRKWEQCVSCDIVRCEWKFGPCIGLSLLQRSPAEREPVCLCTYVRL